MDEEKTMNSTRLAPKILLLLFLSYLCLASSSLAEETSEVIGLIIELSDSKDYIQVNDYSITSIAAIAVQSSTNEAAVGGSEEDLVSGALVKAEVVSQDDGTWTASLVTVYTGDAKTDLLAQLESEEAASLASTESNLSAANEDDARSTDNNATEQENKSESPTLHFQNGVWKN